MLPLIGLPKNQLRSSLQEAILLLHATGPSAGPVWSLQIWTRDKHSRNVGWCRMLREHCSGRQHFLKPRMTAAFPSDSSFHSISLTPLQVTPQKANWCSLWKLFLSDSRCCRCRERPFHSSDAWAGKQLCELGFTSRFSFSAKLCHSHFTDEETGAASRWAFCWRSQDSVISELCFTTIGT